MATKETLIGYFANGQLATGPHFQELIETMKVEQDAVSDSSIPTSGSSTTFLAVLSQDANGKIAATKKTVNFTGYQTVAGMSGYQDLDLQQVGEVTAAAGGSQLINHNMKHYPTVRLIDEAGMEMVPSDYRVKHTDNMTLTIELDGSLTGRYRYVLD